MISSRHVSVGQTTVEAVNVWNMRWNVSNFAFARENAPIVNDFF